MEVTNHRLTGVPFVPAADQGGVLVDPVGIVIHYTGGLRAATAVARLSSKDEDYLSAHLVIDRDGACTQLVPFDRQAYHAGESSWTRAGVARRCNARFFGIELVNPGYRRDGVSPDWPTRHAAHAYGGPFREWYAYPDAQIHTLILALGAIRSFYSGAQWIVGHEDVSPGRKLDPGPAFPWHAIQSAIPGAKLVQAYYPPFAVQPVSNSAAAPKTPVKSTP